MDYLEETTGYDLRYWIGRVEVLIAASTTPPAKKTKRHPISGQIIELKGHGNSDPKKWMQELTDEIIDTFPDDQVFDGNMRLAAVQGMILSGWFSTVQRAKTFDPNRPIAARRKAFKGYVNWATELCRILIDLKTLAAFSSQKFQFPYDPKAKGGSFV